MFVLDPRGRVVWMSDALRRFIGAAHAWVGRPITDLVADAADAEAIQNGLLDSSSAAVRRIRLRAARARSVRVELRVVAIPCDRGGEPIRIAVVRPVVRDDRHLREGLDRTTQILDSSPDAVVAVDERGFVFYANPALERLLGHRPAEVVDQPLELLLSGPDDVGRLAVALQQTGEVRSEDLELRHRDGRTLTVSVSASELRQSDGGLIGTVVFLRDVTERRRFECELARKNEELQHYIHAISHDLRSPLVSLLGFTHLLRQDYGARIGDKGLHFLDRVEQAGRTMEELINDLLELSRIGSGEEHRALVNPGGVLRQLVAELKPRLDAQAVTLVLPENAPLVLCDRMRLYQVFANLIGNALDHMGPCSDPRVTIEVLEEPAHHHIVVSDNGRGIAAPHPDRIFELFYSAGHRPDGRRGTGVGLAIVKKIAESNGGRVWAESEPGQGSRFHVLLPRSLP